MIYPVIVRLDQPQDCICKVINEGQRSELVTDDIDRPGFLLGGKELGDVRL